jgi:hypothetical protein
VILLADITIQYPFTNLVFRNMRVVTPPVAGQSMQVAMGVAIDTRIGQISWPITALMTQDVSGAAKVVVRFNTQTATMQSFSPNTFQSITLTSPPIPSSLVGLDPIVWAGPTKILGAIPTGANLLDYVHVELPHILTGVVQPASSGGSSGTGSGTGGNSGTGGGTGGGTSSTSSGTGGGTVIGTGGGTSSGPGTSTNGSKTVSVTPLVIYGGIAVVAVAVGAAVAVFL